MGLNDQVQGYKERENAGPTVFKDGLKLMRISGDDPIFFRILPAFNPQDPNPRTSVYPSRYANGELTDWGVVVLMSPMVGHGNRDSGHRKTIVSLKTYNKDARCPLDTLVSYIYDHKSEWGYLVGAGGDDQMSKRAINRPTRHLICNIVNVLKLDQGVQLGIISPGAAKTLVNPEGGLCFQENPMPEEGNFFSRWVIRDFTDPVQGIAFKYVKPKSNKMFTSGRIEIYIAANGAVRCPLNQEFLAQRINLSDFNNFLLPVTEQSIIADLVEVLTGRSPSGVHEYVLLKQVFPQVRIPDPPAEGAYISSGFGQSPGGVPPDGIPMGGMPPTPAPYAPPAVPPAAPAPQTYAPPAPPAGAPQYGVPPVPTPVPAPYAPPAPPAAPPMAGALPPPPPATMPPTAPPMPPTAPGGVPLPPVPPPPAAGAGAPPAVVPGDPVTVDPGVFGTSDFEALLKKSGKKQ